MVADPPRPPAAPDGIRYRLKHDPSRAGVALFDRVGAHAVRSRAVGALVAAERRKLLAAILREYGFGLVGVPPIA